MGTQTSQKTSTPEWERPGSCGGAEATGAHREELSPSLGRFPDPVISMGKPKGK